MIYKAVELHDACGCAAALRDVEDGAAEDSEAESVEKEMVEVDDDVSFPLSVPVAVAYRIVVPFPSTTTPFGPALKVCPPIVIAGPEILKV